jgi:hypothetical protein
VKNCFQNDAKIYRETTILLVVFESKQKKNNFSVVDKDLIELTGKLDG